MLPTLVTLLTLTAWCAQAHAQSYTAKLLNQPTGASSCINVEAKLSENGDVTANCFMPRVTLAGIAVALVGGLAAQTTPRAVAWRNGSGSAQVLSGTLGKPMSYGRGVLADGTVMGYIGSNNMADDAIGDLSAWKGSSRSAVSLPSGYAKPWFLEDISRGGVARLLTRRGGMAGIEFAIWLNGKASTLPTMPAACGVLGTLYNAHSWTLNDAGQVAVLRQERDDPMTTTITRHTGTLCLWDGGRWQVSPPSPNYFDAEGFSSDYYEMTLQGLSNSGKAMVRQGFGVYEWAPGQASVQLDPLVRAYGQQGEWLGGDSPYGSRQSAPASVWRNGQRVDLSQVATAPSGYHLSTAVAANQKGQILVIAQKLSATSNGSNRLVLLTPR
jgi:hypothetical protein